MDFAETVEQARGQLPMYRSLWPYLLRNVVARINGHADNLTRLVDTARQFRVARRGRLILHYAPQLEEVLLPELFLLLCCQELELLTRHFGFRLGKVRVFLFADCKQIEEVFQGKLAGCAVREMNAIVIAGHENVLEHVRHELVHLFALAKNPCIPPLFSEGLPVWLQATASGYGVHSAARFLFKPDAPLSFMVDPRFFFESKNRHWCYAAAGSFTGFLIERYGWQLYWDFYQHCGIANCQPRFHQYFGLTLEEAESPWRDEISRLRILDRYGEGFVWQMGSFVKD